MKNEKHTTPTHPHMVGTFKNKHPLADRIKESKSTFAKYPSKIPCIIELDKSLSHLSDFQPKWVVEGDTSLAILRLHIQRRFVELKSTEGLFLFVGTTIFRPDEILKTIYSKYKDEDGFLYFTISKENVFGNCL